MKANGDGNGARGDAERAVRDSERYRAFISNSPEGIWRLQFDPQIDTSLPV
jgi:PAS domain-containing protein